MPKAATKTSTSNREEPRPTEVNVDPSRLPPRYGMRVAGDCMAPMFDDGALLEFDQRSPIMPGDVVAFYLRPEIVRPGEFQARVKRLPFGVPAGIVFPTDWGSTSPCIVAEMLNPPQRFVVDCADILAVHKCLGVLPLERLAKGPKLPPPQREPERERSSSFDPRAYVEGMEKLGHVVTATSARDWHISAGTAGGFHLEPEFLALQAAYAGRPDSRELVLQFLINSGRPAARRSAP